MAWGQILLWLPGEYFFREQSYCCFPLYLAFSHNLHIYLLTVFLKKKFYNHYHGLLQAISIPPLNGFLSAALPYPYSFLHAVHILYYYSFIFEIPKFDCVTFQLNMPIALNSPLEEGSGLKPFGLCRILLFVHGPPASKLRHNLLSC